VVCSCRLPCLVPFPRPNSAQSCRPLLVVGHRVDRGFQSKDPVHDLRVQTIFFCSWSLSREEIVAMMVSWRGAVEGP
jgi:hypothetical protein